MPPAAVHTLIRKGTTVMTDRNDTHSNWTLKDQITMINASSALEPHYSWDRHTSPLAATVRATPVLIESNVPAMDSRGTEST